MGLDMYLKGKVAFYGEKRQVENGFSLSEKTYELGYWRKHPNLHGYIVNTFAGSVDECQEISLNSSDIKKIMEAVIKKELPYTKGFFFGKSDGSEDEETLQILNNALRWLENREKCDSKYVVYQASW